MADSERGIKRVLLIEPFYGGSHKQLMDLIYSEFGSVCELLIMPATKWQWRARCSALYFAQQIPRHYDFKVLFSSSVLNLAELIALRPDLAVCKKILYFHENQLVYPVQWWKERDFQYGYNQVLSCLVADVVLFNSNFNKESFLNSINRFLTLIPDHRPKDIVELIKPKCEVLYYPINFSQFTTNSRLPSLSWLDQNSHSELANVEGDHSSADWQSVEVGTSEEKPLHILWPHRWEHDKDPDSFFNVLFELHEENVSFLLTVLGQRYSTVPAIFDKAKNILLSKIVHWGYCDDRSTYLDALRKADVVVSTAQHEFFGVAMLEAAYLGCYPLCPNRLSYPEIFPKECLYNTPLQLKKRLRNFSRRPSLARNNQLKIQFSLFNWDILKGEYAKYIVTEENIKKYTFHPNSEAQQQHFKTS